MVFLQHFICVYSLVFLITPILSEQFYDQTDCRHLPQLPGSNYLCNSDRTPCQTFILYRAQENFQSLSSISSLFNANQTELLTLNNLTDSNSLDLYLGRELIIPLNCSCSGRFSQAIITLNSSSSDSFSSIACGLFEGLLKEQALAEQNPDSKGEFSFGLEVSIPVRCACPDVTDRGNGVSYFVTYPIAVADNTTFIAKKFGVLKETILAANNLESRPTIYPQTTLLIPVNDTPVLNLEFASSPVTQSPDHTSAVPLETVFPSRHLNRNSFVALGVVALIAVLILALMFLVMIRRPWCFRGFQPLAAKSSQLSPFSVDFIAGMSKLKHSILIFTLDDLKMATGNFCSGSAIGSTVYRGRLGETHLAIEEMSSEEEAHHVIDILTKINHLNVVRLEGFCHEIKPYLVFEYATNGCLRECLSNKNMGQELTWKRRIQVLSDFAVGLHYIHYYTSPSYVHRNINSRNILITTDWRAKISGFKWAKPVVSTDDKKENKKWLESVVVGKKGYLAPEYFYQGLASPMMDIFAFGVVLLELLSAKEAFIDGLFLKDCVKLLVEGELEGSSGCLEKLKRFMDPALEGDYPLGDALCLAILAKACVEEDPHHRPTMNDVLKALSRVL